MEPLAVAGYVAIVSNAFLAVLLGAFGGVIAWLVKRGLLWVGVFAAGGYFAETVVLGSSRLAAAAIVGMPPLIMTFLTSWLTAYWLEARARFRRLWATLVALACALLLGCLWLFLFRLSFRVPVLLALAADLGLIAWLYRLRHALR